LNGNIIVSENSYSMLSINRKKKYKQLLRETKIILEKERRKSERSLEDKQYKTKDDIKTMNVIEGMVTYTYQKSYKKIRLTSIQYERDLSYLIYNV
jgi:hypothetical protein